MSGSRSYRGLSDAQANAEAIARRSTSYPDEHAASWEVRFGTPTHELSMKALLIRLGEYLAEETPMRLHEGPDHIDAGGVPAMTSAFMGRINSGPSSIVGKPNMVTNPDGTESVAVQVGDYRRPLAAAVESMGRCTGKIAWWGAIVSRILYAGEEPVAAAQAEGSHPYEARRTAHEALAECYRRYTPDKMALPRRDAVA